MPAPGLSLGIGDDAAVWSPPCGSSVVLTVDAQVEDVHFRRGWLTPREIGRRAVSTSISDLAAMAARPVLILVSHILEKDFPEADFRGICRGIVEGAARHGARVAGGNLSSGAHSISVTAVGEGRADRLVLRSGARPGDAIWVTGSPGLARLGRLALARGVAPRGGARPLRAGVRAFKDPVARVDEALALARRWRLTSMIDLSDGLSTDLGRILEESSLAMRGPLGAEIDESALLSLPHLVDLAERLGERPIDACLEGGDDYELCFTARPPRHGGRRVRRSVPRLGTPLTRIGRTIEKPGIWLVARDGARRRVESTGWQHF